MGEMKTLHELVADKLERADEKARRELLQIPLDNIARWLAHGHTAPHRLKQWRQILICAETSSHGFSELLKLLRDKDEAAQRLRDFAPFAGVLDWEQRQQAIPECAYNF